MTYEGNHSKISAQDFKLDKAARWCPGCGSHAVLAAVQRVLPDCVVKTENVVFVSGIGCSSRFPYYINTYGFHGLHGRGAAIATGIKIANPELSVWLITGDGDSMAIGGNHFIHLLRRNLDINILLFNNKIYGLTKGQYSPTTPTGTRTKSSPDGTIENPFLPGELAMGAQGTFFARVIDNDMDMMKEVFLKAAQHKGTSLVEVLQNCVIFNDDIHKEIADKNLREENQLYLQHGQPMLFGKNKNKGIMQSGSKFVVVRIGENGIRKEDILIHDAYKHDDTRHYMLARMILPDYPVAMGVIRSTDSTVYEEALYNQIEHARHKSSIKCVDDLLTGGNTFRLR
ncbi:MAG: 2-oxoacid:ferredoxin oxidoreductase subunit beta [Bacteroidales bacterium]|nr:2-oxoacid:ferredoxin oxidoreductase subunit beta [Bacteroidales bacterium]MBN2763593.1 2-oxoacid:ferredoxin oxidoreductase subunit beta [Bacteroidales bacterium]